MIDCKSVRVGNKLFWGVRIVTIEAIHTKHILDNKVAEHFYVSGAVPFSDYYCLKPIDLEPIPITEEILTQKLGITVIDDNPKQKPHYEGDIIFNWLGFEFTNSGKGHDLGFYSYAINEGNTHYKFLHQFQNLYYTLTGEELNIQHI